MVRKLYTLKKKSRFLKFTILRSQLCLLTIVPAPGTSRKLSVALEGGYIYSRKREPLAGGSGTVFYALFVLSAHMTPEIGIVSLLQMGT